MHLVLNGEEREDAGVVGVERTQRHREVEGEMWVVVKESVL